MKRNNLSKIKQIIKETIAEYGRLNEEQECLGPYAAGQAIGECWEGGECGIVGPGDPPCGGSKSTVSCGSCSAAGAVMPGYMMIEPDRGEPTRPGSSTISKPGKPMGGKKFPGRK